MRKRNNTGVSKKNCSNNIHIFDKDITLEKDSSKRKCTLCGNCGHHQYLWKKTKDKFGKHHVSKIDLKERDKAARSLVISDPMVGAPLQVRGIDDNRIINLEFPKNKDW